MPGSDKIFDGNAAALGAADNTPEGKGDARPLDFFGARCSSSCGIPLVNTLK